ncbi:carboxypeptidase-like regulatory domain-containing protein [Chloracidobacterium aggregatum]|uniref:Carboxypeptidase regulatory-like domain-containing protein n=1 Tax=Chloracidobacterium sp. N TaxID=2821540 RepID=A0ABX8AYG4_9BACT|nr:carboxypeptidase-like regulatory domain-containing protein [Chloracidobacterium aggregatum]QUV84794.1 carboxypeptidase regulatory-like domain-containing protein [Chloracidobacterium sp. 2]QUV88805.1 carboxypeptidase regulatory-like domain-containing protein [Chloracidobacterium sp. S]QUV91721.1 carboxypeptidase regulatory-like domain-containing protein [Chloracidobacterium sp. A]QUV92857.1 carboxypeptidase regulatory-like domain-containing protein [Chloracidobacterium sp. N]QUV96009.1 carbo
MLLYAFQRSTCFLALWLLLWSWGPASGRPSPVPSPVAAGASRCCGRLYVTVRAEGRPKPESRPVAGVKVELRQRPSETALTFETDRNGRGAHVGIPEGVYRVRFTHPDFTTVEITEVNVQTWPPVELVVDLPPRLPTAPNVIRRLPYRTPLIIRDSGSIRTVIRN